MWLITAKCGRFSSKSTSLTSTRLKTAIRAGYSKKTARSQGQRLLTNVDIQTQINKQIDDRAKRTEITGDAVLQELAAIGFANMLDFAHWDGRRVKLKSSSQLTRELASKVSELSETPTRYGTSVKFKLHDKLRALEMLAKHLGLFDVTDRSDKTLMQLMHEAMTEGGGDYSGDRPE